MADVDYGEAHRRNSGSGIDDDPVQLTVICAWCGEIMVEGDSGAPVSHGLCRGCQRDLEEAYEEAEADSGEGDEPTEDDEAEYDRFRNQER